MRSEAIFLNGVYESVLQEILAVQRELPEHIMFLQPFSPHPIKLLRDGPPSVDDPVRLVVSTTTKLDEIAYSAEIVGWDDKTKLSAPRRAVLTRLIDTLQPQEGGLYDNSKTPGAPSLNLLHVRRLAAVPRPFSVTELIKIADGAAVSGNRTTAGGWSYIRPEGLAGRLSA